MFKLAVVGAHGVGKTTLCDALEEALQNKLRVGRVSEVARQCPYGINNQMSYDSAVWVVCTQTLLEMQEGRRAEVLICDRSVYDPMAYLKVFGPKREAIDSVTEADLRTNYVGLLQFVEGQMFTYDAVVFISRGGKKIVADGVRDTDSEKQRLIQKVYEEFLVDFRELQDLEDVRYPLFLDVQSNDLFKEKDSVVERVIKACGL